MPMRRWDLTTQHPDYKTQQPHYGGLFSGSCAETTHSIMAVVFCMIRCYVVRTHRSMAVVFCMIRCYVVRTHRSMAVVFCCQAIASYEPTIVWLLYFV